MDLTGTQLVAILIFCQQVTWGAGEHITVQDGADVEIRCQPPVSNRPSTIWFRSRNNAAMEFIGSYDFKGTNVAPGVVPTSKFDDSKVKSNILKLKSFKKEEDSGLYICATYTNLKLVFGPVTQLVGVTVKPQPTVADIAKEAVCTTAAACSCTKTGKTTKDPSWDCAPLILGSLVGSCGFLLLLLIIISLYCNKIRTRRCPHHHKRKPRTMPSATK